MKKQEYIKVYINNFYFNHQTKQWEAVVSTFKPTYVLKSSYSILVPIPPELLEENIPLNTNLIEEN